MSALSPRQLQIAELLARGKNQREIAHILGISYHTVRCHVKAARSRTSCGTSVELAVRYARAAKAG